MAGRYAEPYQSAYRSDQVLQLPLKVAQGEGEWDTMGLPQALREYPPTVTAAGWMAQVTLSLARSLIITASTVFEASKMSNSVVLLLAAWRHVPARLCPKSMCPFDPAATMQESQSAV